METGTMSRILLTVIILALMSPSLLWISSGLVIFGGVVLIGGIAILWWIWSPKQRSEHKTH